MVLLARTPKESFPFLEGPYNCGYNVQASRMRVVSLFDGTFLSGYLVYYSVMGSCAGIVDVDGLVASLSSSPPVC